MKTLCLVLTFQATHTPDRLLQGRTVEQWLDEALARALPGVPRRSVGPWENAASFLQDLETATQGYDEVLLVPGNAPFLRPDLVTALLDLHREYRADYTFADGFPSGLAPEIVQPSILPLLRDWAAARGGRVDHETLFQLLSTDINRFDVETHLSPIDLRSRRLHFVADSARNWVLLDRYASDACLDTSAFLASIETSVERTRTLPATLHVQIVDGVLQVPVWSPVLQFAPDARERRGTLSRADWNSLLDSALLWAGDLTVLPSFWGEPSLHPEIAGLLADAVAKPGLRVCLETSGLGWSHVDLESWAETARGRIDWIVELDSDNPETYRSLRGDGFDEAHAFVERLLRLFPGSVWPQTVRMAANEGEMESFYKRWTKDAGRVIIQKHNDFGGRLSREKPSDLSPWKRHPCWHLARDLAVFLDGTVVVCRDDFRRTQPLGNVKTDDWAAIWERGAPLFERHAREDWPEVCRNCDEWYTFHF